MIDPDRLEQLLWEQSQEHAIVLLDADARIVGWRAGAELIFGYAAEEVIGREYSFLFRPKDIERKVPEKEIQIAASGVPAEDDRWMQRKDGVGFWATGTLQAILSPGRQILGYGKVLRNRTDLRAQMVSLSRDAHRQQADEDRKNRFIVTLAHELRNPLNSLSMAIELLKHQGEEAETRGFSIGIVERQFEFMRRLVDDLLELTRLEQGKATLNLSEQNLGELLNLAAETCRPIINEKRHTIHLILDTFPIRIMGDAIRLQQIFVNLIQNAAKYTDPGGEIWVKLFFEGEQAVVKVADNGIGISPELLPKIFDLFVQAESSDRRAAGGLGIGLSLVKDFTRLHGGSIQVRSDGIGRGSEFVVRFPLAGQQTVLKDNPEANHPDGEAD